MVNHFLRKRSDFTIEDAAPYVPSMFVDGGFVRILPHRHAIDGAFAVRLVKKKGAPGDVLMAEEEELPEYEEAEEMAA